jgi:hypothetical protein
MMRWGLSIVMAVTLTGALGAQGHTSADLNDNSAIYTALLRDNPAFQSLGRGQGQCWAIADTTVNFDDMNPKLAPDAQLRPPSNDPKPFQEALADFNARKYIRVPMTHLSNSQYVMVTPDEADKFRASKTAAVNGNGGHRYSDCGGVTYFSDVYFSAHRKAALVYMLNWCGNLCGQGEWVYLEKHDDRWRLRSGQAAIVSGLR